MAPELEITAAMTDIGEEVGPNIAVVISPERRDFDPISLLVAFGGILLASYIRGLREEWSADAEAAGRKTAKWLHSKVAALFDKAPAEKEQEASAEVSKAIAETAALPQPPTAEQARAARQGIVDYLTSNGMSGGEAARIANIVSERGALLIAIPAAATPAFGAA